MTMRLVPWTCLMLLLLAGAAAPRAARAAEYEIEDPGHALVTVPGEGVSDLSGITHAGGDRYYAVSDTYAANVYLLTIEVDTFSGAVSSVSISDPVSMESGSDLEAIVYHPDGELIVADEATQSIRRHDPETGLLLGTIAVPVIFSMARSNLGLESLGLDPDTLGLWTGNEQALKPDGLNPGIERGTLVRLQRFDAESQPAGQWPYWVDPIPGEAVTAFNRSGLVEILPLAGGDLLTLERSFAGDFLGGTGFIEVRIHQVDVSQATDVSGFAALDGAQFVPAQKTLLWSERFSGLPNFESFALGPVLANGDRSLLLLTEGIGGPPELKALRLLPEPAAGTLCAAVLVALAALRRARTR
jgi:hypothetical protein